MNTLNQLQQRKSEILKLAQQYGITNIRVFGSVASGRDSAQSDIDFLVELEKGRSLFDIGGAKIKLEDLLGRKVDIVTEQGLHWYVRDEILKEARPI